MTKPLSAGSAAVSADDLPNKPPAPKKAGINEVRACDISPTDPAPVSAEIARWWPPLAPEPRIPTALSVVLRLFRNKKSSAHNTKPIPAKPPKTPPRIGGRFSLEVWFPPLEPDPASGLASTEVVGESSGVVGSLSAGYIVDAASSIEVDIRVDVYDDDDDDDDDDEWREDEEREDEEREDEEREVVEVSSDVDVLRTVV